MPVPGQPFVECLVFAAWTAESAQLAEFSVEILRQPLPHFGAKRRVLRGGAGF
ncbi:Uncharacterised protein [Mycobacteroides abscessus subsp. abscessus]|nr:Uncharacterised protein [Mycobacteroides abscessus subsp. abscessus]